jgi:dephospho-CoA kinase
VIAIGLTGGIGSGKSTVAANLAALGAAVVDSDEISRAITAAGGAAIPALREAFAGAFFDAEGALDRAAMRDLVFADGQARSRLEAILHPAIRQASDEALARARGPYVLLVVPLLFETRGGGERVARTLVVDCSEDLQVSRAASRSGLEPAKVRAIMGTQWPRWRRLQAADDVIWNGGSQAQLAAQCERLHRTYCQM